MIINNEVADIYKKAKNFLYGPGAGAYPFTHYICVAVNSLGFVTESNNEREAQQLSKKLVRDLIYPHSTLPNFMSELGYHMPNVGAVEQDFQYWRHVLIDDIINELDQSPHDEFVLQKYLPKNQNKDINTELHMRTIFEQN